MSSITDANTFRFTSPGLAGDLSGDFHGDRLSLSIDAFGDSLLRGNGYPGRLDGESPVRVEAAEELRHESHDAADFVRAAVRATYADGTEIHHSRSVLFKHRDYWAVTDRLCAESLSIDRRMGISFDRVETATLNQETDSAALVVMPVTRAGFTESADGPGLSMSLPAGEKVTFMTVLVPVAPDDTLQIDRIEGIEAEGALALRAFFLDGWVHTLVDKGENRDFLTLNWLPIRAEISLMEITPSGDLSRSIEFGRRDHPAPKGGKG